jgi:hypothetical protein
VCVVPVVDLSEKELLSPPVPIAFDKNVVPSDPAIVKSKTKLKVPVVEAVLIPSEAVIVSTPSAGAALPAESCVLGSITKNRPLAES